jgi:hypothetical protein
VIPLLALFACLLLPIASGAQEKSPRFFRLDNSLQAGPEYDTNVYRTYAAPVEDELVRLLFRSRAAIGLSDSWMAGWNFQLGGKLFFHESAQNLLIQYIEVPLTWSPTENLFVTLAPDFKLQYEAPSLDNPDPVLAQDINEDFHSTTSQVAVRWTLPAGFSAEPYGSFTYYRFRTIPTYSYYQEKGGIVLKKFLFSSMALGAQYAYLGQQFYDTNRADRQHEFSGFFQYLGLPYFTARYTYERSTSNDPLFSFRNHRVTLTASVPFGERRGDPAGAFSEDDPSSLFALHAICTLQFKNYPSVFAEPVEGQRYLQTGAEDDNFNQLLLKLTIHPTKRWAFETKFTQYASGTSNQPFSFGRSLSYAGLRVSF